MNTQFDFLTKELVNSFSYTTITKNRNAYSDTIIDGRAYTKYGTLQAVTIVGNLYHDCYGNEIMTIGISRQNPCDSKCNKSVAYESAQMKALTNPDMIINNVPEYVTEFNFGKMMSWYVDMMNLEYIKTRQEIMNEGKNPKNYDR